MWRQTWHKKQASLRNSLRNTYLNRIWGHKLFAGALWEINSTSIAGGLALGLFISFTPTIPFHMFMAAVGAIYFRVNLPIALVACWVVNPLTAVPIYTAAWKLGKYIVENITPLREALKVNKIEGKTTMIIRHSIYLWIGSLVFSVVSAFITIISVRILGKSTKLFDNRSHSDKPDKSCENQQGKEQQSSEDELKNHISKT